MFRLLAKGIAATEKLLVAAQKLSNYSDLTSRKIIPYADELISLLGLLHDKALSKRGYSWTGKLLSSLLLTMTHTYPLENKFVNADQWASKGGCSG